MEGAGLCNITAYFALRLRMECRAFPIVSVGFCCSILSPQP